MHRRDLRQWAYCSSNPGRAGAIASAACVAEASSKPAADSIPIARSAVLDVIAKTLAIGQMTVFGTPFAIERHRPRVEFDAFGNNPRYRR
jgi:hypothetical protein